MDLKNLQKMIEGIGNDLLGPDDDWLPVLFLEKDNSCSVIALNLFGNSREKDMAAVAMRHLISSTNPDSACFVSTSWISEPVVNPLFRTAGEYEGAMELGIITRPKNDPDRKEVVTAVLFTAKREVTLMMGYIQRFPDKHPEITRWKIHKPSPSAEIAGRFGEAMRDGFANADKNGNLDILNKLGIVQREDN